MGPGDARRRRGRRSARARRRARPRSRSGRRGTAPRRSPWRTSARTRRRRGAGRARAPARPRRPPRTRSCRRCRARPRSRRAARTARRGPRGCARPASLTGAWRCEVPSTRGPLGRARASASGRTFDGPQPKRPSAGLSSAGIWAVSVPRRHRGRQVIDGAGGLPPGWGRLGRAVWQSRPTRRGNRCIRLATKPISTRTPNRWTTFFRLLLAIPWFIVAIFWLILFAFTHFFAWVPSSSSGATRSGSTTSLRHRSLPGPGLGLVYLQTDVWPPFGLSDDPSYPIRVNFAPPAERQCRLKAFFRIILACRCAGPLLRDRLHPSAGRRRRLADDRLPRLPARRGQQHADLRQQLPGPALRLPRVPHRRYPPIGLERAKGAEAHRSHLHSPSPSPRRPADD